jgi:hypothetical protein
VASEEAEEIAGAPSGGGFAHLRETGVGPAALDPWIDTERLAEPELEGEHLEAAAFSEKTGEPLADEGVLLNEMCALTDRDNTCVADEGAERLEVVERRVGIERGERCAPRLEPFTVRAAARGGEAQRDCLRANDL